MKRGRIFAAALVALATLGSGVARADKAHVAVAANFTEPAKEIAAAFRSATGHEAVLSFGSSGQFYTQIKQEAPFEAFLSADDERPKKLVEERGLKQVTDTGAIEKAVDEVIAANPDKAEQAKAKPTLSGWFVGQVMKATGGKANPQAVNDLVKKKLGIE